VTCERTFNKLWRQTSRVYRRMKKVVYIEVLFTLLAALPVQADVINEVNATASTGGNGKSEARVFIETTVNGEVVEHVDEHAVSETGEPIELNEETHYVSEEGREPVESSPSSEQEDITTTNIEEEESESSVLAVWYELIRSTFIRYGKYFFGFFMV
jgi:hypothetical protein